MSLKDIGTFKETIDVELMHPVTGEPLLNGDKSKMTITVHGPYSKLYKKIQHDQQNRRLMKAQRTGGKMNLTTEEIEASTLDLLVRCTTDWNVTLEGDDKTKFSSEAVRETYIELPWVREQVDAVIADTRAFLA